MSQKKTNILKCSITLNKIKCVCTLLGKARRRFPKVHFSIKNFDNILQFNYNVNNFF